MVTYIRNSGEQEVYLVYTYWIEVAASQGITNYMTNKKETMERKIKTVSKRTKDYLTVSKKNKVANLHKHYRRSSTFTEFTHKYMDIHFFLIKG